MVPERIGHYEIRSELGRGGMGIVYEAYDTRLQRRVALKCLSSDHVASHSEKARLLKEARAAAGLNHPAICTIYEIGEADGQAYIAMELVLGETLTQHLATNRIPWTGACDIVTQVGQGLAYAHAQGILHRDIKPDNIMITTDGDAKLMDFGLALDRASALSLSGDVAGTLAYMAPEQLLGEAVDQRADVWALGVVLYECLTGSNPYQEPYAAATSYRVLHSDPEPPSRVANVSAQCDSPVAGAMARDLSRRTASIEILVAELKNLVAAEAAPHSALAPASAAGLRIPRWAPLAIVPLLVAGFFLLRGLTGNQPHREPALAVIGFMGDAGETDNAFGVGLIELINIGLVESGPVRVVSPEYIRDLQLRLVRDESDSPHEGRAMKIARQADATYLLTGHLTQQEGRPQVVWRLVDTVEGSTLTGRVVEGAAPALIVDQILQEVVPHLSQAVGAKPRPELRPVRQMTTKSPLAYRHYVAGLQAARGDRIEDAMVEFQTAVDADTTFALAYLELSMVYANLYGGIGDTQSVADARESAWRNRNNLGLRDRLRLEAWRLRNSHDYAESRRTLEEIITRWPDDRQALLDLAELLWHHWHFQDALDIATQGANLYADDLEFLTMRVSCLSYLGRRTEAALLAKRCVELEPNDANLWHLLSATCLQAGQPDSAQAAARRALDIEPTFLMARLDLGACAYARGELDSAIALLEGICVADSFAGTQIRVLTSDSFRPALSMLYSDAGRITAAMAVFDRAAELTTSTSAIGGRRARTQVRAGVYGPALSWSDSVLSMGAKKGAWFNAMMVRPVALAHTNRVAEARKDIDTFLASEQDFGGLARFLALLNRVEVERVAGNPQEALETVRELETNGYPGGGMFEINLQEAKARILRDLNRPKDAIGVLQRLLKSFAGRPAVHRELGILYRDMGQFEAAQREFDLCLRLWHAAEPGFQDVEIAREYRASTERP